MDKKDYERIRARLEKHRDLDMGVIMGAVSRGKADSRCAKKYRKLRAEKLEMLELLEGDWYNLPLTEKWSKRNY